MSAIAGQPIDGAAHSAADTAPAAAATLVLGSVQPSYLAWIPFMQRMAMSDVFVYLDDVQYCKNSFHNRNSIKTPAGKAVLTVPVRYKHHSGSTIHQMPIANDEPWAKKHWRTIAQAYAKAPYFADLAPRLEAIYAQVWHHLADLNIALIDCFRDYLGIRARCVRSSQIPVDGTGNLKLVNLCKALGANRFIVKPGTEDYHPRDFFAGHGIGFEFFTPKACEYPQRHGPFVPGLSILDYAMNRGPEHFHQDLVAVV